MLVTCYIVGLHTCATFAYVLAFARSVTRKGRIVEYSDPSDLIILYYIHTPALANCFIEDEILLNQCFDHLTI